MNHVRNSEHADSAHLSPDYTTPVECVGGGGGGGGGGLGMRLLVLQRDYWFCNETTGFAVTLKLTALIKNNKLLSTNQDLKIATAGHLISEI